MKIITKKGKEVELKFSPQAKIIISKMKEFDEDKFEEWLLKHKEMIGGMTMMEYLIRGGG